MTEVTSEVVMVAAQRPKVMSPDKTSGYARYIEIYDRTVDVNTANREADGNDLNNS